MKTITLRMETFNDINFLVTLTKDLGYLDLNFIISYNFNSIITHDFRLNRDKLDEKDINTFIKGTKDEVKKVLLERVEINKSDLDLIKENLTK